MRGLKDFYYAKVLALYKVKGESGKTSVQGVKRILTAGLRALYYDKLKALKIRAPEMARHSSAIVTYTASSTYKLLQCGIRGMYYSHHKNLRNLYKKTLFIGIRALYQSKVRRISARQIKI